MQVLIWHDILPALSRCVVPYKCPDALLQQHKRRLSNCHITWARDDLSSNQ